MQHSTKWLSTIQCKIVQRDKKQHDAIQEGEILDNQINGNNLEKIILINDKTIINLITSLSTILSTISFFAFVIMTS